MRRATWFTLAVLTCIAAFVTARHACANDTIEKRQKACLGHIVGLKLQQGRIRTWVDSHRWSIAHACLLKGVRLDEANQYFSEVVWASLSHGLIFDTDVQVTDLVCTYLKFRDSDRLSDRARTHLKEMLSEWEVPNRDRNRNADTEYQWPHEYSENHSLNILVGAYLIDHALGRDRALHKELIERFLADRAGWGWSEFNSVRYGMVTAKTLVLLAEHAPDSSVRRAARMHLDLLALQFATRCLSYWRGIPCSRGGSLSPTHDAFAPVARLWFGDPDPNARYAGSGHIAHFLACKYRPPRTAIMLQRDPVARGRYVSTQVATSGPGKLRVPIVVWVSPYVTMASAQGSGSYYDGLYASIRFSTGPKNVITCSYGGGRNIFQHRNVMAAFGTVDWHGDLSRQARGNMSIAAVGRAFVGQITLGTGCHVLMVADRKDYPNVSAFAAGLDALDARFAGGVVGWKTPEGETVQMVNEMKGGRWRFVSASVGGRPLRIDRNLLFDSPYMRSVRGSKLVEVRYKGKKWELDLRDNAAPAFRKASNPAFTPIPPDVAGGPMGIKWIHIPAGEFPMGSPLSEGRSNERPQRWVHVDGFQITETEITVRQYKFHLDDSGDAPRPPDWLWQEWGKTDQYPMTWVTWDEAVKFCEWLSNRGGYVCRLPTEAEWEKAAKGYSHRPYPWGEGYDGTQSGSKNETYLPVKSKPVDKSPFGVMDMAGNTWEWCRDWYDARAYDSPVTRNPTGPTAGEARVVRSCGWNYDPDTFRISYRTGFEPAKRSVHIGFRVVRELPHDD